MPPEGDDTQAGGGGTGEADSILDLADTQPGGQGSDTVPGGNQGDAAKPKDRPAFIAEQFWDPEKGEPRLQQLGQSWLDLRASIARGEHKPPEKPEGYTPPSVEGLPEGLIGGEKDALWPEVRQAAHAAGVSQAQLTAIAAPLLKATAARLKESPPPDPEAAKAERRAALESELGKLGTNGRAVVADVAGRLRGLEARGILTAEEHAELRAMGTAHAVRGMAKLFELAGEKPIPLDGSAGDGGSQAEIESELREAHRKGDAAGVRRAQAKLEALEKAGRLITAPIG